MAAENITTPSGRARLTPRREPYFKKIAVGQHLGYRRAESGGTWIARHTHAKTRQYSALGSDTEIPEYADALKAALRWFKALEQEDVPDAAYTVASALKDYVTDLKRRKGADAATRTEQAAGKHILPVLGTTPLRKLTTRQIKKWQAGMVADSDDPEVVRKSQDTANRVYGMLRAALNAAFRDGIVDSDAAWRRVQAFQKVGKAREVFLDPEQWNALLDACPPDLRTIVRSSLATGGRFGELARRRVSDFDPVRATLNIPDGKTGARVVVLSDSAVAHFRELARGKLPAAFLHVRADGTPWHKNACAYALRRVVAAVNTAKPGTLDPATCFYTLRHSHISRALLAGVQVQIVAENCGTSVAMIEKHYAKFLHTDRRAMFNRMGAL